MTRRTPSTDKYPREPGLIREPTPVEDLLVLGKPAAAAAAAAALTQPSSGVSAALLKPRLFQATEVVDDDADTECVIRGVYGWQGLGVYDDDDLADTSVLLLLCPLPGPHYLWIGRDFDLSAVVELELEDVEAAVVRLAESFRGIDIKAFFKKSPDAYGTPCMKEENGRPPKFCPAFALCHPKLAKQYSQLYSLAA